MIRLSYRLGARMTAIAVILAGTGVVLSGAAPAAGQPTANVSLGYSCRAPGWRPVPARVTVSIPEAATVGQPIQPTRPAIILSVPRADIRHLAGMDRHLARTKATVTVAAQFRTNVALNGRAVADPWYLTAPSARVPPTGSLMVHVGGTVQPVVVRKSGDVTFTAVGLSLRLTLHTQGRSVTSPAAISSGPSIPAGVHLACTLDSGQSATLATVPVTAPVAHSPAHSPATPASASKILWEAAPGGSISGSGRPAKLQDTTTGTVISCKTSATSGTMKFGRDLPGAGIASLTSVTFSKCSGPGGKTFTVTASASTGTPWLLNAQSYNSTQTAALMTVSGIKATVSGSGCTATVAGATATATGTVNGNYADTYGSAALGLSPPGGTLHTWNVSGCSGLFSNGDSLSFTVTYAINPGTAGFFPISCPPSFPLTKGFPFNPHFKFPKPPPGSTIVYPTPPQQGCAYIKGYSNVSKLGEAALIGPGFGDIQVGRRVVTNLKANYFESDSSGRLYYKPCPGNAPQCKAVTGLPPVTATFLSFGFLPTTATLKITEVGNLTIIPVGTLNNGGKLKYSKVESLASITVERVLANGVPLNVGSNCHTVKPFKLVIVGKPPYSLQTGGVLMGMIKVPPFTGCGVGENIDPIFNATVSGPGNIVKLTQGTLCTDWPIPPFGCPASVPKPTH